MAPETPGVIAFTPDQLSDFVAKAAAAAVEAASRGASAPAWSAEEFARINAEANRQVLRPENPQAPGISAYNPEGERDHPRPKLACKTFQNSIELEPEHLDREEIDLLNRLKHGDYYITKTDGQRLPFLVREERDQNMGLQKKHIGFRAKDRDDLIGLPGLKSMMREVLGDRPISAEEVQLRERIAALESKLGAATNPPAA